MTDDTDMIECVACEGSVDPEQYKLRGAVCVKCYRDPLTNNCTQCNKHLKGIPYEYICGDCVHKNTNKQQT